MRRPYLKRRIIRVNPQGFAAGCFGFIETSLAREQKQELSRSHRVVWRDRNRLASFYDGLVELSGPGVFESNVQMSNRIAGPARFLAT